MVLLNLGSLEDGSKDEDKYPLISIYYDKKRKEYRFKLPKRVHHIGLFIYAEGL